MLTRSRRAALVIVFAVGGAVGCNREFRSAPPSAVAAGGPAQNDDGRGGEARPAAETPPPSLRVHKEEGWEIPGLGQSRVTGPRQNLDTEGGPSSGVGFTVLEPRREVVVEIQRYALGKADMLYVFPNHWSVESIRRYEKDGKVFSYVVAAVMVEVGKSGAVVSRHHARTSLYFYDEDGDGRFETFEHGWGRTTKGETPTLPGPWR